MPVKILDCPKQAWVDISIVPCPIGFEQVEMECVYMYNNFYAPFYLTAQLHENQQLNMTMKGYSMLSSILQEDLFASHEIVCLIIANI